MILSLQDLRFSWW